MALIGGVETFGKFTFFYPDIQKVSARSFSTITETWMILRLLKYNELYNKVTDGWEAQNKPDWKLDKIRQNPLTVGLLTTSQPFSWLDEGDEQGNAVTRKVAIIPASGATRSRTFRKVGTSKKVRRHTRGKKKGQKVFLKKDKKIRPRRWSRELIRRESKALSSTRRPYFSRSKTAPGILYSVQQIAFAPTIGNKTPGGTGWKLTKKSFRY